MLYPLAVTGIGKLAFADQAGGSLVAARRQAGRLGADRPGVLVARLFLGPAIGHRADAQQRRRQFRLQPGPAQSGAAPTRSRAASPRCAQPIRAMTAPVPVDLVTASASGLDPEISVAAARYQAGRVAGARKLPRERVDSADRGAHRSASLGFLGESRGQCAGAEPGARRAQLQPTH